jgi:hypothetical protein
MRCPFTACALIVLSTLSRCTAEFRSTAEPRPMSAVYAHQSLSLSIPYEAAQSGDAELKVEVLSPENNVLGHAEKAVHVEQGEGVWNAAVSLKELKSVDEVVWQRISFTLRYEGDGAPAVDQIRSISIHPSPARVAHSGAEELHRGRAGSHALDCFECVG